MVYHGFACTTLLLIGNRQRFLLGPPSVSCIVPETVTLQVTMIKSPKVHLPIDIPPEHKAMIEVFNVVKAARLPPHRSWDCAINLLQGNTPPCSRVYPLSLVETKVMED